MADGSKGAKFFNFIYHLGMTIAVIGLGFFGFIKITDRELFLLNNIFSCFSICFIVMTLFMLVRCAMVFRKNGNKLSYQLWLMIAALIISGICLINSLAEDLSRTKIHDVVNVNDETDIWLCESEIDDGHSRMDIFRIDGIFVRKIGEIDEKLFDVKLIQDKQYECEINEGQGLIVIKCHYGVYGDGIHILNPEYDTKELPYVFNLE